MPQHRSSTAVMPRAWRKATLTLGPITVQVGMKSLSADEAIHAKTLCPCHMQPARQRYICEESGELIEPIKRFEHGDQYVEIDTQALTTEGDTTVELTAAPYNEHVDVAFFGKSYIIWPEPGFDQQYDILAAAVRDMQRTLIGTICLTKKTEVFAVRWSREFGVLLAHTLEYGENIAYAEMDLVRNAALNRPDPNAEYVSLLGELIRTLDDDYDADAFTNDYRDRLRGAIEAAANGTPIPVATRKIEPGAQVVDLMAALKQSVADAKKPRARKPGAKTKTAAAKKTTTRKKVA